MSYSLPEKAIQVCMLFKLDVQGKVFDSNCVEMGVETVEIDWDDGKLQNNIKLVSIEKSRDELFTFGKGNTNVCYLNSMFEGKFSIVIALRWV